MTAISTSTPAHLTLVRKVRCEALSRVNQPLDEVLRRSVSSALISISKLKGGGTKMSLNPAMKVFGIVSQELSEVMRTVNVTSCFSRSHSVHSA